MSQRDILILFLIDKHSSLNNIYSLTSLFDRANFPGNVGSTLKELKRQGLIINTNKNIFRKKMSFYKTTDEGIKILSENFKQTLVFEHIDSLNNPVFLRSLVVTILKKSNDQFKIEM